MPLCGIVIETPALVVVGLPLMAPADYEVNREVNAAGPWSVSFPASIELASQIKTRWRVSLVEEGRLGYLLLRGIVTEHGYSVGEDGQAILRLQGLTRLFGLAAQSTHQGLEYDGSDDIEAIANDLTGETVTAPASAASRSPESTFSDTSKLDALLTVLPFARMDIRETMDAGGSFELVDWDDRPDSGYRFVNVEHAGPELDVAAAEGMGLIAGTPEIKYLGNELANRIIPIGSDFDSRPLTLEDATTSSPYAVQFNANPDSSAYYYIEDALSVAENGLIELPLVRTDIKNPSDDPGTKEDAANVLYQVAAGELLKRRSVPIAFACDIANGNQVEALPGDAVKVQYRGVTRTSEGNLTWVDLDQWFLVTKRRDSGAADGVRNVAFELTAPSVPLEIPELPDAIVIPPPPDSRSDPFSSPPSGYEPPGAYQPCCADGNHATTGGAITFSIAPVGGAFFLLGLDKATGTFSAMLSLKVAVAAALGAINELHQTTDWTNGRGLKGFGNKLFWVADGVSSSPLFRSFDGGLTLSEGTNPAGVSYLFSFDVGPTGRIWGLFRNNPTTDCSLWRSDDDGDTWTLVLTGLQPETEASAVNCSQFDPDRVSFIDWGFDGGDPATLNATGDGGANWNTCDLIAGLSMVSEPVNNFRFTGGHSRWLSTNRLVVSIVAANIETLHVGHSDDDGASIVDDDVLFDTSIDPDGSGAQFHLGMWMDAAVEVPILATFNGVDVNFWRYAAGSWTPLGQWNFSNSEVTGLAFAGPHLYLYIGNVDQIWKVENYATAWSPVLVVTTGDFGQGNTQDAMVGGEA